MHMAGFELRVAEVDRSREDREGRGVCIDTVRKKKRTHKGHGV